MSTRTKLELVWIGKDQRPRLEPRLLIEDKALSYRAAPPPGPAQGDLLDVGAGSSPKPTHDNLLIEGDNLLALKALEQQYAGRVKCIFIDPPYNTGSAFAHYDDGVEHSQWLTLMRDRLELLRTLLHEEGSIWITIDDNEAHYLKVLCDEVFGRSNFVATVVWQKLFTVKNSARFLSDMHEYVLVYAKKAEVWQRNLLPRRAELDETYTNLDGDPRGPWTTNAIQARNFYSQGSYEIVSPTGKVFKPPQGTYWRISKASFDQLVLDDRIWWGKDGKAAPRIKKFLSEVKQGVVPATLWLHEDAGTNAEAKVEVRSLFAGVEDASLFTTPKPEKLIKRILEIGSNPGDLVLDSFAGSGTTGAVAQKMGRRWIMVELGDHCHTHIVPRLKKVLDGQDDGGVTSAVGWKGGGGFRYLRLAPSLLKRDSWGHWVINPDYNAEMLAEAMCKHMGFTYAPSAAHFWQHGHSTESSFIYVTTGSLSHEQLAAISAAVGPERSLLICCKAFMAEANAFANLSIKKIPKAVLQCEWDHDYSFSIDVLASPSGSPEPGMDTDTEPDTEGRPQRRARLRGRAD